MPALQYYKSWVDSRPRGQSLPSTSMAPPCLWLLVALFCVAANASVLQKSKTARSQDAEAKELEIEEDTVTYEGAQLWRIPNAADKSEYLTYLQEKEGAQFFFPFDLHFDNCDMKTGQQFDCRFNFVERQRVSSGLFSTSWQYSPRFSLFAQEAHRLWCCHPRLAASYQSWKSSQDSIRNWRTWGSEW